MVLGTIVEVNGQQKCTTIIDNRSCNLANCEANCKSGFKEKGYCARNGFGGISVCNCKYDCALLF